jgi:hypothetical protein
MAGMMTPAPSPDMTMMPTPQMVHVGDSCNADLDCMEPDLLCFKFFGNSKGPGPSQQIPLPGGYCSKVCNSRIACPTGSECIDTVYGAFCMNRCPANGCRTGYSCCQDVGACGLQQFCGGGGGG